MIIFRTADDMMAAIHVAQVFDKHGLCVVSMAQVKGAMLVASVGVGISQKTTWLIVGQGAEVNITQLNADIKENENGYSEEEPDDGLGSGTPN
jgi:hypothetical protein